MISSDLYPILPEWSVPWFEAVAPTLRPLTSSDLPALGDLFERERPRLSKSHPWARGTGQDSLQQQKSLAALTADPNLVQAVTDALDGVISLRRSHDGLFVWISVWGAPSFEESVWKLIPEGTKRLSSLGVNVASRFDPRSPFPHSEAGLLERGRLPGNGPYTLSCSLPPPRWGVFAEKWIPSRDFAALPEQTAWLLNPASRGWRESWEWWIQQFGLVESNPMRAALFLLFSLSSVGGAHLAMENSLSKFNFIPSEIDDSLERDARLIIDSLLDHEPLSEDFSVIGLDREAPPSVDIEAIVEKFSALPFSEGFCACLRKVLPQSPSRCVERIVSYIGSIGIDIGSGASAENMREVSEWAYSDYARLHQRCSFLFRKWGGGISTRLFETAFERLFDDGAYAFVIVDGWTTSSEAPDMALKAILRSDRPLPILNGLMNKMQSFNLENDYRSAIPLLICAGTLASSIQVAPPGVVESILNYAEKLQSRDSARVIGALLSGACPKIPSDAYLKALFLNMQPAHKAIIEEALLRLDARSSSGSSRKRI